MNYKDTLEYMYKLLPMYQRDGKSAFKKDLTNTIKLCESLGNPQDTIKTIHIAGTNGKGSSAHMLDSVLQSAGYKTGLYTSPHLKSFTERIKIVGQEIEEQAVCEFIESIKEAIEEIRPSFFEITVAMAFDYFAKQKVDVAIIEVGLGGRFDSTNVITPLVSLITSIGLDHTDMLGETLQEIAFEKAGIIKENVPVIISETQDEITNIFKQRSNALHAPLFFADQEFVVSTGQSPADKLDFTVKSNSDSFSMSTDLAGEYQLKNIPGILKVVDILNSKGFKITHEHINNGLGNVVINSGLLGRWQIIGKKPMIICDTVHNELGVKFILSQLAKLNFDRLFMIWGAVEGKKLDSVLMQLPKDAFYYFCEPDIPRALKADLLMEIAFAYNLKGEAIKDVNNALDKAKKLAGKDDIIFIGGSNFIIAEIKDLKA